MATPSNDELAAVIAANGLKVGNLVKKDATGVTVGASLNLQTDTNGNLSAVAPSTIVQPTITSEAYNVTGKSAGGILVNTLVAGADVTTATKAAFIRVALTDSAGNITNGNYYLEVFTIT